MAQENVTDDVDDDDTTTTSVWDDYQSVRGRLVSFGSESFVVQSALFALLVLMGTITILILFTELETYRDEYNDLPTEDNNNIPICNDSNNENTAHQTTSRAIAASILHGFDKWEICMLDRPSTCEESPV